VVVHTAEAKLAVGICTPRKQFIILSAREHVVVTTRDTAYTQSLDITIYQLGLALLWLRPSCALGSWLPQAQLAVAVVAEAPDATIFQDRASVVVACDNLGHQAEVIGDQALTIAVVAKTPETPVCQHGASVVLSGSHSHCRT